MIISVIGLGEVGTPTFEDLTAKLGKYHEVVGVDVNSDRLEYFKRRDYTVAPKAPSSDVYIIAVYLTSQVYTVLKTIDTTHQPLVSIESTIDVKECDGFRTWAKGTNSHLITVPHRFVPNDPSHRVFNLDRVLGGATPEATERGITFYRPLMEPPAKIHPASSLEMAALSKIVDNTTRYAQISWAQNLRMYLERLGYDFNEVRKLSNTKFNIDLPEARDGIKLKCLPKDMDLLVSLDPQHEEDDPDAEITPDAEFIARMILDNESYKQYAQEKKFPKTPDL